MTREEEILYMQVRIIRLAGRRWSKTVGEVLKLFDQYGLYEYIEHGYESLLTEGGEAVLEELAGLITRGGGKIS